MTENIPSATFDPSGNPVPPMQNAGTLEDFKKMMENLQELQKAKNKASKQKKQLERLSKQKSITDQFKRAQRYLGLRPTNGGSQKQSVPPQAIKAEMPVPFPFDQSVVFVCVDVESFERAHHKITEVGIAILDTRDLAGVAPLEDGKNWRSKIRARHYRIEEHKHLVNRDFVVGCPDRFDFGKSEFVRLHDAAFRISECFKPPFAAQPSPASATANDPWGFNTSTTGIPTNSNLYGGGSLFDLDAQRNIIFLGHETQADVKYLQQLGYDPTKNQNILEALDTADMYRVWRRETTSTSLGRILYDFDIAGFNLHNAGNDAVFTLQIMLGICVREAAARGTPAIQDMRSKEKSIRLASALTAAQDRAENDAEGWSDHELDGNGGGPIAMTPKRENPNRGEPRSGKRGQLY